MGTVSVCIPAYRSRFLATTIESVLAQTRPATEVVVVDDCSPDNLQAIVARFSQSRLKYVRSPHNLGVPGNYNQALQLGSSDYVMLFGDHDVMAETFIERCAGLLDTDPAINLVFSAADAIDESGQVVEKYPRNLFPAVFPGHVLARWLVIHMAAPLTVNTLIRRSALVGCEPWFDPQYWWYGDVDLWIRLAARGKVGYVAEPVLRLRQREAGHYLDGREWQSTIVCDRIRRDDWKLAFPKGGPRSWWAGLVYAYRRDRNGLLLVASLLARAHESGLEVLPPEAMPFFSPLGRMLAPLVASFSPSFVRCLQLTHRRWRSLTSGSVFGHLLM